MRVALLIAVSPTSIFSPASTPASEIFGLSMLVLAVTGVIFVCASARTSRTRSSSSDDAGTTM